MPVIFLVSFLAVWLCPESGMAGERIHRIELRERVLVPEDGLLLGNGDLSVSVYETADRIVFRFGKGDVWDRRIDRSDDPRPAHIDEVARGIEVEGWKCPPYGGPVEAIRGTKNPERMREICQAVPPSYRSRPYPCPKPVGELALQLPQDQMGLRILSRLTIEEALLTVECDWPSGVSLKLKAFVPPDDNVLLLSWKVEGWRDETRTGNVVPPVWFSLYRWADPPIETFAARFFGDHRHGAFQACSSSKATPLPRPAVTRDGGQPAIEQAFPPDPTFPRGFHCLLSPLAPGMAIEAPEMGPTGEARLHLLPPPAMSGGTLAVAVATTGDHGGAQEGLRRLQERLGKDIDAAAATLEAETLRKAREFWSKSRVFIADPLIENLWYETFHARRATNRPDRYPPGLFLPSTVQDYSHWHGDYHTNYNLQSPFWGDYTANHIDLGDAYFAAMEPLLQVGRKIARDYYGVRGAFVQLSGYPAAMEDDPLGCVPMGRMAYMTGWAMNQYWLRYLYTLDAEWLRKTGYPAIRDCALFYRDFLKEGKDGLYHIFPSNQGEDGFSGNPGDFTDSAQVMEHLRYCLRAAVAASEVLGIDGDLRGEWRVRLERCAGNDGGPPLALQGIEKECREANPPEFGVGRLLRPQPPSHDGKPWPPPGDGARTWYFGQYPWMVIRLLRQGDFIADRDFPAFREIVERWRHPNGLLWGMSVANYGRAGAWTESLGIAGALQEMMLQSWDGSLRIFPAWPRSLDASFETFRAEGAFLVSAAQSKGEVREIRILSEKGGTCRLYSPWPGGAKIADGSGAPVQGIPEPGNRIRFDTRAGGTFTVEKALP